jgi:RNA polymerase sigma factor (TIGR02999 family)
VGGNCLCYALRGVELGDVTRILSAIEQGNQHSSEELLPLVYVELRRLAARRMSSESPDHTLQPTALVHEAYMRLVDVERAQHWNSRGHFFGAAAQAMRRILVESARSKGCVKRGGECRRVSWTSIEAAGSADPHELLALAEALIALEKSDPESAKLVDLRYFAGLTMPQAAEALGIPLRSAERTWAYARTWLHRELSRGDDESTST